MQLLNDTLARIQPQDVSFRERAIAHIDQLTMPNWALGRVLDLAVDLAGITRTLALPVARKEIILMAGDHGIVAEGVCPQPSSVTTQMVHNFVRGGAGINVLSQVANAHVTIVDMGVDNDLSDLVSQSHIIDAKIARGTKNFAKEPAMTRQQAIASIEAGIRIVNTLSDTVDVFATGEMGIGNTSPSSAIVTLLAGESDPTPYVGSGAGLPKDKLQHKIDVIRDAIALHQVDVNDALDILQKVGGFEIGGIAGVILGAAANRKPVVVDGFISSAGALIAATLSPQSCEYMFLAHGSAEPGHLKMAQLLNKKPLLDLGLRLGEGTGAALSMNLLDAAAAIMNHMATFDHAHVTTEGLK